MLVLALVWWAWSAYVWAANAQVATSPDASACLLISAVAIFISGLSIPHAFGSEGTLFAVSYAVVRFLHLALYADASKQGNASWSAIAGFALTVVDRDGAADRGLVRDRNGAGPCSGCSPRRSTTPARPG